MPPASTCHTGGHGETHGLQQPTLGSAHPLPPPAAPQQGLSSVGHRSFPEAPGKTPPAPVQCPAAAALSHAPPAAPPLSLLSLVLPSVYLFISLFLSPRKRQPRQVKALKPEALKPSRVSPPLPPVSGPGRRRGAPTDAGCAPAAQKRR